MSEDPIYVYMNSTAELATYPDDLHGDMSIFWNPLIMLHEVQWALYLMLKGQGLDVRVCQTYPQEGILLIPKSDAKRFVWNPDLFVVSLQYDYKRDDRGQIHVVSNEYKASRNALGWMDRWSFPGLQYYVPSVMHTDVTPRDDNRGDTFENIVFIGAAKNLDDAFKTDFFEAQVRELGMRFSIIDDPSKQSDYSEIDVVVAIRKLGRTINNKPPVKLINAWRGGVPAILGREIGFKEEWRSEYDFIEVDSVEETLNALKRLKDDNDFRRRMVANGKQRAIPYSAEGQREIWLRFVREKVLPASAAWKRKSLLSKYVFLVVRRVRRALRESLSCIWHNILRQGYNEYS